MSRFPGESGPLTVRKIERAIFRKWGAGAKRAATRFKPTGWFECDVAIITQAGRLAEYEIKMTVADFRADFEKQRRQVHMACSLGPNLKKHDLLKHRDSRGPSRFFFVVPKDMVDVFSPVIPEYSGLIIAGMAFGQPFVKIQKRAPVLHKEIVPDAEADRMTEAAYLKSWRQ